MPSIIISNTYRGKLDYLQLRSSSDDPELQIITDGLDFIENFKLKTVRSIDIIVFHELPKHFFLKDIGQDLYSPESMSTKKFEAVQKIVKSRKNMWWIFILNGKHCLAPDVGVNS